MHIKIVYKKYSYDKITKLHMTKWREYETEKF